MKSGGQNRVCEPALTADAAQTRQGVILIVGGAPEDAQLVSETLLNSGVGNPIEFLPHAQKLQAYLKELLELGNDAATPALILLDLTARAESGFGVLRFLNSHYYGAEIPVVVLIGEMNLNLMPRAYQLGVRTFLKKPLNPEELIGVVETLKIQSLREVS